MTSRIIIVGCVKLQNQCNSYDATHAHNQRVTSQNPLKSQDGGKKTAFLQKRVSFVAGNISRDA